jgi:hypothetical protein
MDQHSPQKWFNLEEQFYKSLDNQLLENLRAQSEREQNAESIMKLTGLTDRAVADKLASINIKAETLAAFCLVPLVTVAWADDHVAADESYVIERAASEAGLDANCLAILKSWLKTRPGSELFETWCAYSKALAASLNEAERISLRDHVIAKSSAVAKSSGGVLGLGAVSPSEKAALERIKAVLE